MSKQIVEEIFEEIRLRNLKEGPDSIPHSDELINHIASSMGINPEIAKEILKILINSHKIFAIEIVADDKHKDIPRIEGYVETDLSTIKRLNFQYQDDLVKMYENEFYMRKSYFQVVKEIFPRIRSLNNTPIGLVANKAIMLGEFEKLLEKHYNEYTDEWKEKHLEIELSKANLSDFHKNANQEDVEIDEIDDSDVEKETERAVDSNKFHEFVSKSRNYPLKRILNIYGVEFFFRAHLRNYKFSYLTKIVESGSIFQEIDLLLLKRMLSTVKMNFDKDQKLKDYLNEIYALERAISHCIYFVRNPSKSSRH